ncbi:MAG: hypothetical protein FWE16_04280 [Firmicutes bacterium]|nr:hypothetical protein [Bacillota bacterium]
METIRDNDFPDMTIMDGKIVPTGFAAGMNKLSGSLQNQTNLPEQTKSGMTAEFSQGIPQDILAYLRGATQQATIAEDIERGS